MVVFPTDLSAVRVSESRSLTAGIDSRDVSADEYRKFHSVSRRPAIPPAVLKRRNSIRTVSLQFRQRIDFRFPGGIVKDKPPAILNFRFQVPDGVEAFTRCSGDEWII